MRLKSGADFPACERRPGFRAGPAWGIVSYIGAAVLAGSFFAPSMMAMMGGAALPASVWLLSFGSGIEFTVGVCLASSLPFMLMVGLLSVRKTGEAIEDAA